ncbi:hypothetical protein LZL87_008320 [Fusarium oxysporum]|nr:hypothetical protein LZL87_008320 [Fusarium oxysporum]
MRVPSTTNIPKETVSHLDTAPIPKPGILLQIRAGRVKKGALGGEITSAIYKQRHDGLIFCSATGVLGDEHASSRHGGTERAVHQYNPDHYPDWRAEKPPEPDLSVKTFFSKSANHDIHASNSTPDSNGHEP